MELTSTPLESTNTRTVEDNGVDARRDKSGIYSSSTASKSVPHRHHRPHNVLQGACSQIHCFMLQQTHDDHERLPAACSHPATAIV